VNNSTISLTLTPYLLFELADLKCLISLARLGKSNPLLTWLYLILLCMVGSFHDGWSYMGLGYAIYAYGNSALYIQCHLLCMLYFLTCLRHNHSKFNTNCSACSTFSHAFGTTTPNSMLIALVCTLLFRLRRYASGTSPLIFPHMLLRASPLIFPHMLLRASPLIFPHMLLRASSY